MSKIIPFVTPTEYRLVKQVVGALNDAYSTKDIHIPAERWNGTKIEKFTSTPDPYFSAYKNKGGNIWWICNTNIYVYRESYDFAVDFCKLIEQELGMKACACQVHVTFTSQLKHDHKLGKVFFIGVCSWSDR